jgi:hypothetical protein
MYKKTVSLLLLAISCTTLLAQQKMTLKDIIGKWQIAALITDNQTLPIDSDEALRNFMYQQMINEKKGTGDSATLTSDDSSGVELGVKMIGMFRESEVTFLANKTFKFSLSIGGSKKNQSGTWIFNAATQTITIKELKKGKPVKGDNQKVIIKGTQLLMQMEKDKEEGFLLSKKK